MKKHLHQKSFPMGKTRCSWLYSFRNDSLNCDRDKSREITTTEPPHLYILLFVASQLLNILLDFCGVSTIRFLSLSSSFCFKKIENPWEKSGDKGWRKNVRIFLSRSVCHSFAWSFTCSYARSLAPLAMLAPICPLAISNTKLLKEPEGKKVRPRQTLTLFFHHWQ